MRRARTGSIKNPLLKKTHRFDKHEQKDGKLLLCRSSCRRKCGPAAGGMGRHGGQGGPAAGASSGPAAGGMGRHGGQGGPAAGASSAARVDEVRAWLEAKSSAWLDVKQAEKKSSAWLAAKQAEKVELPPEIQQALEQYIDHMEMVPSRRACDQDGDATKVSISTSLPLMSRVSCFAHTALSLRAQTIVDVAMVQQSLQAALDAAEGGQTIIFALWPPTPRGRQEVAVGDFVLFRFAASQKRGIPGIVTELEHDRYTVWTLNGVFKGVLQGRLLKFELVQGQEVDCVHGRGTLLELNLEKCRVKVGDCEFELHRLAVLPSHEPGTGFGKNATVDLMKRKCGTALVHLDILTGEAATRRGGERDVQSRLVACRAALLRCHAVLAPVMFASSLSPPALF